MTLGVWQRQNGFTASLLARRRYSTITPKRGCPNVILDRVPLGTIGERLHGED